jgi:DNA repair protein RadC
MNENRHLTMKELPESERPYERVEKSGACALSDAELLAIIIQSGTKGQKAMDVAYDLLNMDSRYPGLEGLTRLKSRDFQSLKGIGRVKSIQLEAVFELAKRVTRTEFKDGFIFDRPKVIADYYMAYMSRLDQEELHVMMLDTKNRMISERLLTKGTVNASFIEPREIFVHALRENAVSIVLVHNHPSGDDTPSREDIAATKKVHVAGQVVGIRLIDHIIIGNGHFTSLCREGLC